MHFPVIDDELPGVVVDLVEWKFLPSLKVRDAQLLVGTEFPDRFDHSHVENYHSSRISAMSL